MLKTSPGPTSKTSPSKSLVVFAVGGRRLAARADDVGGVRPWTGSIPIPSRTPFINAVVRHGEEVLPVYDLAASLNLHAAGSPPLCLIAKHRDGPVALCIDAEMPTMCSEHTAAVRPITHEDPAVVALCQIGTEDVPIYSLAALGQGE